MSDYDIQKTQPSNNIAEVQTIQWIVKLGKIILGERETSLVHGFSQDDFLQIRSNTTVYQDARPNFTISQNQPKEKDQQNRSTHTNKPEIYNKSE